MPQEEEEEDLKKTNKTKSLLISGVISSNENLEQQRSNIFKFICL